MLPSFRLVIAALVLAVLALAATGRGLVPPQDIRTRIGEVPEIGRGMVRASVIADHLHAGKLRALAAARRTQELSRLREQVAAFSTIALPASAAAEAGPANAVQSDEIGALIEQVMEAARLPPSQPSSQLQELQAPPPAGEPASVAAPAPDTPPAAAEPAQASPEPPAEPRAEMPAAGETVSHGAATEAAAPVTPAGEDVPAHAGPADPAAETAQTAQPTASAAPVTDHPVAAKRRARSTHAKKPAPATTAAPAGPTAAARAPRRGARKQPAKQPAQPQSVNASISEVPNL